MSPGPGCGAPCVCWDHYHVKMGYRAITRRPALLITAIWSDYPHTPPPPPHPTTTPPQYTFLIGCSRSLGPEQGQPIHLHYCRSLQCSFRLYIHINTMYNVCHICLKSESPQVRGNSIPGLGNPILLCLHPGSGYSQATEVAPVLPRSPPVQPHRWTLADI